MKFTVEDEKKKLNEAYSAQAKKMAIFHIKRKISKIIGELYAMNQEVIDEYDLDMIVSQEKYDKFTHYIANATHQAIKAKNVLEK